jgi:hypothetical protein
VHVCGCVGGCACLWVGGFRGASSSKAICAYIRHQIENTQQDKSKTNIQCISDCKASSTVKSVVIL